MHLSMNRNVLNNANMSLWQRGTSFASAALGKYSADRWYCQSASTDGVITIAQDTSGPDLRSPYDLKVSCTTADETIPDDGYLSVGQLIEGHNWDRVRVMPMTLSFWVKSYQTGTFCVALVSSGADEAFLAEYVVNSSATWEYKTVVIPPAPAGTWGTTTNLAAGVHWLLACGADFQGSLGWQAANVLATGNQTNMLSSTDDYWQLARPQLEPGGIASQFEFVMPEVELERCQRYYVRITNTAGKRIRYSNGLGTSTTTVDWSIPLPTVMRSDPTMTSSGDWYPYRGTTAYTASTISKSVAQVYPTNLTYCTLTDPNAELTAGNEYQIYSGTAGGEYVALEAELA